MKFEDKKEEKVFKPEPKEHLATVKLEKDHFHSGIFYLAGTEIKVDETSLRFIEDQGIGKRV